MTHLLKWLVALISNLVLVAFGNLIKGSTLQPQMHAGGSWLAALPNHLPYQCWRVKVRTQQDQADVEPSKPSPSLSLSSVSPRWHEARHAAHSCRFHPRLPACHLWAMQAASAMAAPNTEVMRHRHAQLKTTECSCMYLASTCMQLLGAMYECIWKRVLHHT